MKKLLNEEAECNIFDEEFEKNIFPSEYQMEQKPKKSFYNNERYESPSGGRRRY